MDFRKIFLSPIEIDFSGESTKDFTPVPQGTYKAVVENFEEKEGPTAPYLNWTFSLLDSEYKNQKVWLVTSLKEGAKFRLLEVLRALGFEKGKNGKIKFDPTDVLGQKVTLIVEVGEYEGVQKNIVKKVLAFSAERTSDKSDRTPSGKTSGKAPAKSSKRY